MTTRAALALLAASFAVAPTLCSAADNTGIYAAANNYRTRVLHFEKVVNRVRGIERTDERLVDQFEEATKDLRLAAKNPRHANRLRAAWARIQPMQFKVERTIFNKYTLNHELYRCWQEVLFAGDIFYHEYLFQLDNSRHGNSVTRRPMRSRPDRFVPPPPAGSDPLFLPTLSPR